MSDKNHPQNHLSWNKLVAKYRISNSRKSIWQFLNSFIPFIAVWYIMFLSIDISYWLTFLLAFPASGFIVRVFIIQHDCGHGSFFKTRKANDWLGTFCSFFTFTPYHYWRKSHAIHHASNGNLEQRGIGDIYTMTVNEYLKLSVWGRFKYRIYRNPFILFVIFPSILFMFIYRFPVSRSKELQRLHSSIYITNLIIGTIIAALIYLIGVKAFLIVQLPITIITSTTGMWLFYIQHQFEDTYWNSSGDWDYTEAAIKGSSYYKLPKVLQWFTGNIGLHHIHHLSPGIPNYMLEKCHIENPLFHKASVITLRSSFRSILLRLWDENQQKLISFYQLKNRKKVFLD
jgi:acyl-lipid omega-6 desaturase (Delta-12 desaturase)